jgi:hypothetical protein
MARRWRYDFLAISRSLPERKHPVRKPCLCAMALRTAAPASSASTNEKMADPTSGVRRARTVEAERMPVALLLEGGVIPAIRLSQCHSSRPDRTMFVRWLRDVVGLATRTLGYDCGWVTASILGTACCARTTASPYRLSSQYQRDPASLSNSSHLISWLGAKRFVV